MTIEKTTATCLTPPAAGGIAVVQVIGPDAPAVVNPLLHSRRPIDISRLPDNELRFCRIRDRDEVLDDAVIAARRLPDGSFVVDINLHGGPRIVQRLLLALKAAGVQIVEAAQHARRQFPTANLLEQEAVELLPRAKTRAVAVWLARAPEALTAEARRIDSLIAAGDMAVARTMLAELAGRFAQARYLLEGIRVVLTGEPNSGKSTLANALAGAEHVIVSETAGTTRDWVEIPAAVEGVPVTLVDTAGVRETDDPLERESIRRARAQLATADLIIHVIDRSAPPGTSTAADRPACERAISGPAALEGGEDTRPMNHAGGDSLDDPNFPPHDRTTPAGPRLVVWNKSDLPPYPGLASSTPAGLNISSRTGMGLGELRQWILQAAGLARWSDQIARPFTERQRNIFQHWFNSSLTDNRSPSNASFLKALTVPEETVGGTCPR